MRKARQSILAVLIAAGANRAKTDEVAGILRSTAENVRSVMRRAEKDGWVIREGPADWVIAPGVKTDFGLLVDAVDDNDEEAAEAVAASIGPPLPAVTGRMARSAHRRSHPQKRTPPRRRRNPQHRRRTMAPQPRLATSHRPPLRPLASDDHRPPSREMTMSGPPSAAGTRRGSGQQRRGGYQGRGDHGQSEQGTIMR